MSMDPLETCIINWNRTSCEAVRISQLCFWAAQLGKQIRSTVNSSLNDSNWVLSLAKNVCLFFLLGVWKSSFKAQSFGVVNHVFPAVRHIPWCSIHDKAPALPSMFQATLPGPTNLPRIPALQGNLGRKLPSFSHLQSSMDWFKGPIAGTCFFDSWELSLSKLPHLGINLPFRTDPCLLVVSSPIHPILGFVWICLQCLQSQQLSMFGWMPHGVKNWSSANQGYQWMVCNITVTLPQTNMTTLPRVGLEHEFPLQDSLFLGASLIYWRILESMPHL